MYARHTVYSLAVAGALAGGTWLPVLAEERAAGAPAPYPPVPSPAQMTWHKAEYRMFAHFGMKTFYPSDDHMGYGEEDPQRFNPRLFDAAQWVEAAKAGGFEGIVLTTKHHDGFCNWPTDTTDHCVTSSPWKDGKGDVVGELIEACRKGHLSFGVYVSIIDKHFERAGSPRHAVYGDYYLEQIRELSTRYGPIDEYWFDGFKADELHMDYRKITDLIRDTQPDAVVYDSGTMVAYLPDRCLAWPRSHGNVDPDQVYRQLVDGHLRWYPNEPSLILQGNWFHNQKPIVSLDRIKNDYLTTVGHGVTPLMNVSPNQDGLIDQHTVARLSEFKTWVDGLHAADLGREPGVRVTAATVRGNAPAYRPENVVDGRYETYYATDDGVTDATIEIDLGQAREIEGFIIQEYIPLGQRVDGYRIDCRHEGEWVEVFAGKTLGYKRIVLEGQASATGKRFPPADRVRLRIADALACPLISTFQVIGPVQ